MIFFECFFSLDFFCCKKTLRYKKPKFIYVSESKSFFFDACSHERRRRRRQKRTRPAKNAFVVSWWRWWWSKSCLSVSSSNRELSPLFETASCRDPHTKKREEEISLRSFRFEGHTTTTRETDCSSHITCVFRGVWDDEEVARPRKAEAWVCDTADDLDAAVCMTLSLLCRLRRACFLCRIEEREREIFFVPLIY